MPESNFTFGIPELNTTFVFRRQPIAIPADLRPGWRIGLVVLLLKNCCRNGRSSHKRMHVLSWGISSVQNRVALQASISGDIPPDAVLVRVDPFLTRAMDYAVGEALIRRHGGNRIELTPNGRSLATEIEQTPTAYVTEKQFIDAIRFRVTEALVDRIFGNWS